jgi:type IV pilus assembly protein PilY1
MNKGSVTETSFILPLRRFLAGVSLLLGLGLGLGMVLPVSASVTVVQSPLTQPPSIKPNIMLMLDDSGSMASSVMPDHPSNEDPDNGAITSTINGVYYNPNTQYDPPYTATAHPNASPPTATRYPAASFANAWLDGFNQTGSAYNLSTYGGQGSTGYLSNLPHFTHTFQVQSSGTFDSADPTCSAGGTVNFSDPNHPGSCSFADSQPADCPSGYTLSGTQCVVSGGIRTPDCGSSRRNPWVFNNQASSTTAGQCVQTTDPGCSSRNYHLAGNNDDWANAYCRRNGHADQPVDCDDNPGYTLDASGLEPYENDPGNLKYNQCYVTRGGSYPSCPSGYMLTTAGCTLPPATPNCANHPGYTYDPNSGMCNGTAYPTTVGTPGLACPDGYDSLFGAGTSGVQCRKTITAGGTIYRSLFVYAVQNSDGSFTRHFVGAASEDTSEDSGCARYYYGGGCKTTLPDPGYPGAGTCADITQNAATNLDTGENFPGGVPVNLCDDTDAARQNVANWFSYYHTRILMAKSGLMNAFATLDEDIRFGFGSINGNNDPEVPGTFVSGSTKMAQVAPFGDGTSDTRREEFWSWVDSESTGNNTPLRTALRDVGNYYKTQDQPWISGPGAPECAGKTGAEQTACENLLQLSCRQSYTILTTDGFWNNDSITLNGSDYQINGNSYNGDWDGGPSASSPVTHTDPNGVKYIYKAVAPYAGGLAASSESTLADIAMYFWLADLRPSLNDNVPTNSDDPAFWQHMTTFTVGLFPQDTQIPYKRTDTGASASTTPAAIFAWAKGGAAVPGFAWPQPKADSPNNIGDLVHAGLDGHGGFYAASDPDAFANGIRDALRRVAQNVGSGASLAANSTKLDTGTTTYQAIYFTGTWKGDLRAFAVNGNGTIATNATWTASAEMPAAANRTIKTCTGNCTGATVDADLSVDFKTSATFDSKNDLCADSTACGATEASDIINYLRGDASKEQSNGGPYRSRTTALGDIVDSQPVFAGAPDTNQYAGTSLLGSHTAFANNVTVRTRRKLLYVAANDGMLHAFNAESVDADTPPGTEMYAYMPKAVIKSGIKNLASQNYGETAAPHLYYNDGELAISDVQIGGNWKTVLVGTTGRGPAKAIYALDITDPANIKLLWERSAGDGQTNSNYIGEVVGKPVIARVTGGSWVALMGNGYNSSAGTPALLQFDITTGALSVYTTTGSANDGLSPPAVWISDATLNDNISTQAYAGDLQGNVWAFNLTATGGSGTTIYTAKDSSSNTQPITAGLIVAENPADRQVWVFFGTGSVLSTFDSTDGIETWYGLIVQGTDAVSSSSTRSDLKQRTIVAENAATATRLAARGISIATAGDMTGKKGWYIDLLSPGNTTGTGERMVTPNQFQGRSLIGTTRLPTASADPCNPSGSGWIMAIDPFTGSPSTKPFFDINQDGSFTDTAGGDVVTTADGQTYVAAGVGFGSIPNNPIFVGNTMLISFDNAKTGSVNTNPQGSGAAQRLSWRELITQ